MASILEHARDNDRYRAGIAAGGIFNNVRHGTASQLKIYEVKVNNKKPN